jgi:nickel superoxide dismutase
MKRWGFAATALALAMLMEPAVASAHCQVPCGIYDDQARIQEMLEDAATIRKAMKEVHALSGKTEAQSANQRIRWTMTKEAHAANVIEVVSVYFLTQKTRIPAEGDASARKKYHARLEACHRVMHAAMRTRQTVEEATADALVKAIHALSHPQ